HGERGDPQPHEAEAGQGVPARPQRAELDPLGAQGVGEGRPRYRRRGHAAAPWYSTLSSVSSMKASSSDGSCGVSSLSATPRRAATAPIASPVMPETTSAPASPARTAAPAAVSNGASAPGSAARTSPVPAPRD